MNDLISRQMAIDAIERNAYRHTYIDQIVDIINALPSAQPEPCEDAVGRDAVVRFLDDWISALDANCHHQSMADLKIVKNDFKNLPSTQPCMQTCKSMYADVSDLVSRQAAIDLANELYQGVDTIQTTYDGIRKAIVAFINLVPSAQSEPLTDKEQRIFLAAMGREEQVCEEVDRNYVREPYEDSLVRVCKEIRRKVKGALWT